MGFPSFHFTLPSPSLLFPGFPSQNKLSPGKPLPDALQLESYSIYWNEENWRKGEFSGEGGYKEFSSGRTEERWRFLLDSERRWRGDSWMTWVWNSDDRVQKRLGCVGMWQAPPPSQTPPIQWVSFSHRLLGGWLLSWTQRLGCNDQWKAYTEPCPLL